MRAPLLHFSLVLFLTVAWTTHGGSPPRAGVASWYGEAHRGRLMANGKPFNPDKLTAASWFYPLGTKLKVVVNGAAGRKRTVTVTITDRGPAWRLVREGRIIDLTYAAFKKLGEPDVGLLPISVRVVAEDG